MWSGFSDDLRVLRPQASVVAFVHQSDAEQDGEPNMMLGIGPRGMSVGIHGPRRR
jgi:hypothetical protein